MATRSEIAGKRRDGTEFPARASIARIETPDGTLLAAILQDLTDERRREEEFWWSETLLANTASSANVGTWVVDVDSQAGRWSDEVRAMFGQTSPRDAAGATGATVGSERTGLAADPGPEATPWREFFDRIRPGDRKEVRAQIRRALTDGHPIDVHFGILLPDDEVRMVHARGQQVRLTRGGPRRMIGTIVDTTEQHRNVEALAAREQLVRSVLDSMGALTAVVDREGRITATNRAWQCEVHRPGSAQAESDAGEDVNAALARAFGSGSSIAAHARAGIRDVATRRRARFAMDYEAGPDDARWFTLSAEALDDAAGGAVVSLRDITDRKWAEAQLAHNALHDPLTGLPNRTAMSSHIERALAGSSRTRGQVAVLFLDFDRFKVVNDSLGHPVGDELLVLAAQRLQGTVRSADTVTRFGGDEFAIVCEGLAEAFDASKIASAILEAFAEPFVVADHELFIELSIGIAVASADDTGVDALVRNADTAMYIAKEHGGNRYHFFDEKLRARADQEARGRTRAPPRRRPFGARALLPAAVRPGDGSGQRCGGAHALAPPRARAPPARRVHRDLGGNRPHRRARRVGDQPGL